MVLSVLVAADGMVDKRPTVNAAVHDDRHRFLGVRTVDVRIHERAVLQRDLDVAETPDAEHVAANLVARGGRRSERSGLAVGEDVRPIQVIEEIRDDRVLRESQDRIRRGAWERHQPVAEVDAATSHQRVDLRRQGGSVVGGAVLIERLEEAGDVGQTRIGQLVELPIDPRDDVGDCEPLRTPGRADQNRTDRERDDLVVLELEGPIVVRDARAGGGFELQANNRSRKPSSTQHESPLQVEHWRCGR